MPEALEERREETRGFAAPAALEARGLGKRFESVRAVRDASLALAPGEVVALVGDCGAGKSTLLRMLAGALQPDAGVLALDGRPVRFRDPGAARAAGIEMIHQDLALAENLDAAANVFLGDEARRRVLGPIAIRDDGAMRHTARRLLANLDVRFAAPELEAPVRELSGGQRQAVALARALRRHARIVLMDEPCASLGLRERLAFAESLRSLKARAVAVLLAGHRFEDFAEVADRIVAMRRGRIVGQWSGAAVDPAAIVARIADGRHAAT